MPREKWTTISIKPEHLEKIRERAHSNNRSPPQELVVILEDVGLVKKAK